ncbi:hypothetical protein Tco_0694854 [Tanacetum coccineum]
MLRNLCLQTLECNLQEPLVSKFESERCLIPGGDDWRGLGGDKERLWGELARLECKVEGCGSVCVPTSENEAQVKVSCLMYNSYSYKLLQHDYDFCIDDDDDVKEINPYLEKKKKLILESKDYQQTLLFMDKLKFFMIGKECQANQNFFPEMKTTNKSKLGSLDEIQHASTTDESSKMMCKILDIITQGKE